MKFNEFVEYEMLTEAKKRKNVKNPGKELLTKNKKLKETFTKLKGSDKPADPIDAKIQKLKMQKIQSDISSNEAQIEIYKLQATKK